MIDERLAKGDARPPRMSLVPDALPAAAETPEPADAAAADAADKAVELTESAASFAFERAEPILGKPGSPGIKDPPPVAVLAALADALAKLDNKSRSVNSSRTGEAVIRGMMKTVTMIALVIIVTMKVLRVNSKVKKNALYTELHLFHLSSDEIM